MYDVQGLKEISREKRPHDFEISQVCICEDHANVYQVETAEEFKKRCIVAYMKQGGSWIFKRVMDWDVELFSFNGYNLSIWCFYAGKFGDTLLWNQWGDRDKCYYQMKMDGENFALGSKKTVLNAEFLYLMDTYNHKMDRDKLQIIGKQKHKTLGLKDKERLYAYIKEVFNEEYEYDGSTTSCVLLVYNQNQNVYNFIHSHRRLQKMSAISSNVISHMMKKAEYTNNNRCVHAHFDNVFFDGIDKLTFKIEGTDYIKKIPDKTHFAKGLGV